MAAQRRAIATMALMLVALPTVAAQQPFLEMILTPVLNVVAQSTCSAVLSIFKVPKVILNCKCKASLKKATGFTTDVSCALQTPWCLVGETFCGKSTLDATYENGLTTGLSSGEACMDIEYGFPDVPLLLPDKDLVEVQKLCITGTHKRRAGFESCNVTFGETPCASCSVCDDSGVGVTFDCSNVNISPVTSVFDTPGPKVEQCVGIGIIPSLGARSDSVLPFGKSIEDSL